MAKRRWEPPDRGQARSRELLSQMRRRLERDLRLGCELNAHHAMGFCAVCTDPVYELTGWRLLAVSEHGVLDQPKENTT